MTTLRVFSELLPVLGLTRGVCVFVSRCERRGLQPLPQRGAAEGLADGLSPEFPAWFRTRGPRHRRRSDSALCSSLQILTGECPTLFRLAAWKGCFLFSGCALPGPQYLHTLRRACAFTQYPHVRRRSSNTSPSHFNNLLFQLQGRKMRESHSRATAAEMDSLPAD